MKTILNLIWWLFSFEARVYRAIWGIDIYNRVKSENHNHAWYKLTNNMVDDDIYFNSDEVLCDRNNNYIVDHHNGISYFVYEKPIKLLNTKSISSIEERFV